MVIKLHEGVLQQIRRARAQQMVDLLYDRQPQKRANSTCALPTFFSVPQTASSESSFFFTKPMVKAFVPIGAPSNLTPALSIRSTSAGKGSTLVRFGHQISFFFTFK